MTSNTRKILIIVIINVITTLALFYLFEENKDCIADFGSRCSNTFLLRCIIQISVLSAVMYFMTKPKQAGKQ